MTLTGVKFPSLWLRVSPVPRTSPSVVLLHHSNPKFGPGVWSFQVRKSVLCLVHESITFDDNSYSSRFSNSFMTLKRMSEGIGPKETYHTSLSL